MASTYRHTHLRGVPEGYGPTSRRPVVIRRRLPGESGLRFRTQYLPSVSREAVFAAAPHRYTLVRGHVMRIPQAPRMANPANERAKRRMAALRATRGNKCEVCEDTGLPGLPGNGLEWAHIAETGVGGLGRGRKERVYDISKHPDRYALMCRPCHRTFDKLLGPLPSAEAR